MKIRINILLTSFIVFFISCTSLSQTDTTASDSVGFQFDPKFYSVQVEACVLGLGAEIGGLVDVDLFNNKEAQTHFIGMRLAVELYAYRNIGGGGYEYSDICLYARTSLRFSDFRFNAYGGLAFHTENRGGVDSDNRKILTRGGLEAKYFPFCKYFSLVLKASTSFTRESGFVGLGIALGYFN
ncbi:hypothetical protein ACFLSV_07445 [Bacteroidota bacterium]